MSRVISAPIDINAYDLISQIAGAAPIENFLKLILMAHKADLFLVEPEDY